MSLQSAGNYLHNIHELTASVGFEMCITHTQPFYGSLDFVQDNPGEPVREETFTHSHLSWSSVIPYVLPPSITQFSSEIFSTLPMIFLYFSPFVGTIVVSKI